MRILLTVIVLSILFASCGSNTKDESDKNLNNSNLQLGVGETHEQNFGALSYTKETQWDSLKNNTYTTKPTNITTLDPNYKTFGWHIYSNGSAYKAYDFSLLWGISYFSYLVEPKTGSYKNIHQWKTTNLIDSAKAHNTKVFLTVANFGKKDNSVFLKNKKAQARLIDSLTTLLAYRDADGINIDFEGVSKANRAEFTSFIVNLSQKLKQANSKYMVSLCLYAIDWNKVFDITALKPHIDFYTLMAYDYNGSFSKTAGPVTPLKTTDTFGKGMEFSVDYYLNQGVDAKQLIVGLPYYGAEYYTKTGEVPAKVKKFKSHPAYNTIKRLYIDSLQIPVQFDDETATSYLVIKDGDHKYRQLWFEDKQALSLKYDWIKSKHLGGVGIWALGFDNGFTDLWDLLENKFANN